MLIDILYFFQTALLKHYYSPKNFDKKWSTCRQSINQMALDLRKKKE